MGNPDDQSTRLFTPKQVDDACAKRVRQVSSVNALCGQALSYTTEAKLRALGARPDETKSCIAHIAELGPVQALHLLVGSTLPLDMANYISLIRGSDRWQLWMHDITNRIVNPQHYYVYIVPLPLYQGLDKIRTELGFDVHVCPDAKKYIPVDTTLSVDEPRIWLSSRHVSVYCRTNSADSPSTPLRCEEISTNAMSAEQVTGFVLFVLYMSDKYYRNIWHILFPCHPDKVVLVGRINDSDKLMVFQICIKRKELSICVKTEAPKGSYWLDNLHAPWPGEPTITTKITDQASVERNRRIVLDRIGTEGLKVVHVGDSGNGMLIYLNQAPVDYLNVDLKSELLNTIFHGSFLPVSREGFVKFRAKYNTPDSCFEHTFLLQDDGRCPVDNERLYLFINERE